MNEKLSAGLLMFARNNGELKLFLVHPGGPFFTKKDEGYWSIPKGLPEEDENDLLETAKREFEEETGIIPGGEFIPLGTIIQKNKKVIHAWAFEIDKDDAIIIKCNTFDLEWPPKSGKLSSFPEVDRGEFFSVDEAKKKINSAQIELIDRLEEYLENKKV
jgi:predicted NUDIX family NTP pyrophosphohydrolase